jgi:hypothetical protein
MKKAEAYWPLILLLAIVKFLLPLFLQSPVYELQRDEYLYYQQGQHLALGYLENPPLLGYLGWISSWFGDSAAWIKLWPCLFGAGTLVITCLIVAELGGRLFAQFLAALGIITGAYMRVHFLFQPNMLEIFFWTLCFFFLVRYINTRNENYIYGIALSLALGWWSKYSVLFLILALIAGLALSPHRTVFLKKKTWIAAGLALLFILPNIYWQYSHNWPLVHHMDELRETQLKYISKTDFLKEQLLLLLPVVFVWICGLAWLIKKENYRIIAIIYTAVILLLMFGSGKGYYTLGVYPVMLAAGATALEQWTEKYKWIQYAIGFFVIGFTWLITPLLLPTKTPEKLAALHERMGATHKWEDQQNHPLPQDFADMLGWRELTEKAENAFYQDLPQEKRDSTVIFCANYGQAGSLKFYGNMTDFKERVISSSGSFLLWIPDSLSFRHLLFINNEIPDDAKELFAHFSRQSLLDSVTNPLSRQRSDKIFLFENADDTAIAMVREMLKQDKKQFSR